MTGKLAPASISCMNAYPVTECTCDECVAEAKAHYLDRDPVAEALDQIRRIGEDLRSIGPGRSVSFDPTVDPF